MKTTTLRAPARRLLRACAAALVSLAVAGHGAAQEPDKDGGKRRPWESRWRLSLGSEYDDNLFRLRPGQKNDLGEGRQRYEGMASPRDLVNSISLRGELRGPGLSSRPARVGAQAAYEAYTLNTQRSSAAFEVFARQRLSKRDEVGIEVSLQPSEFRRSYLIGGGRSAPEYAPAEASTLAGRLGYEREILRGKRGGPELSTALALVGGRRTYELFPWRDRVELGGEVEAGLELAERVGLELSARRLRAFHGGQDEPVYDRRRGSITWGPQQRDFDETTLGAKTRLRLSGKRELSLSYAHRLRDYLADGGSYRGREDTRRSYGAEMDLVAGKHAGLALGGRYIDQTTLRPGRGDTGDEADYTRSVVYLRMNIFR